MNNYGSQLNFSFNYVTCPLVYIYKYKLYAYIYIYIYIWHIQIQRASLHSLAFLGRLSFHSFYLASLSPPFPNLSQKIFKCVRVYIDIYMCYQTLQNTPNLYIPQISVKITRLPFWPDPNPLI